MIVEIDGRETRLIAIWSPKEKRHTFLVTNLKAEQFSATQISQLYRLRWQIELLFKECKSHNNLQGFQTSNPALMEANYTVVGQKGGSFALTAQQWLREVVGFGIMSRQ